MKCPSCQTIFSAPAPQCPKCKLTLHRLDIQFGAVPRYSRFVTDCSGRLPRRDIADLRRLLRLFNRKFPQSRFSVFVTNQLSAGTISEYAFWLMNRARFGFAEAVGGDNYDLLLTIDVERSTAALIAGYGLETYITERDLERALAQAASGFHEGDFAQGIRACVEVMMSRMRAIVKKLEETKTAEETPATTSDTP